MCTLIRLKCQKPSGSIRKSRRTSHFNNMDLPEGIFHWSQKGPGSPLHCETRRAQKTDEVHRTRRNQDDSVLAPGLVFRKPLRKKWHIESLGGKIPFHPKFVPPAEQEKAHGPFLPGENSNSQDPYGEEPFPPCNPHPGDDPYGIADICNIYDWIDSP